MQPSPFRGEGFMLSPMTDLAPDSNAPAYSVSELAFALKRTLEDRYGFVRLRGELSKVTHHSNGHVYLTIKDDKAAIDEKTTALMAASQKLGEKMYADQQAAQAAAGAGAAEAAPGAESTASRPADDDNIVDAEVKEVKKG